MKCRGIDFSINGQSTQNRLRSQRTPTPYKIKVNNSKFIYLVIRIELSRSILMLRFSHFLRNSIIYFRMFSYLRVTVSLLCRLQAVSKTHVPIYSHLKWIETKLSDLVTGTAMKPWLSGNMLRNIKTWFSQNLRIAALKLIQLTQFLSPNLSMYSYLL